MTRLFQILTNLGLHFDDNNDNLMDCDEGSLWECPLFDKSVDGPGLPALSKVAAECEKLLGSTFRGVEVRPPDMYDDGTRILIYLTKDYRDEGWVNKDIYFGKPEDEKVWGFWHRTEVDDLVGPFDTQVQALVAFNAYVRRLDGEVAK